LALLSQAPVNTLTSEGFIRDWLVVGAFPSVEVKEILPDGSFHTGFGKDYLESLGDETKALLKPETTIAFKDEQGQDQIAQTSIIHAGLNGKVNLGMFYHEAEFKVAYAFCYIQSDKDQTAYCYFGSDDGAKVWVNGKLAHKYSVIRNCLAGEDTFTMELKKGLNPVMVKVFQGAWHWEFVLETYSPEENVKIENARLRERQLRAFQKCRIGPKYSWDYIFPPGKFPEIQWKNPYLVEQTMGKFPLNVRWFDAQLNEVTIPEKPGRYGAVVEGTTPDGNHIRRGLTFYCRDKSWNRGTYTPKAYVDYFHDGPVDKLAWQQHSDLIASWIGNKFLLSLESEQGAVLISYLTEIEALENKSAPTDNPTIRDADYHLALNRKLLGVENKYPKLKMPHKKSGPAAPVLRTGTLAEAGMKSDATERIRQECLRWIESGAGPFNVLIARRGVIVIHESFPGTSQRPFDLDSRIPIASVTKVITGLMLTQFIDQGLIDIDDPIGKFLPDFPTSSDKVITIRNCLTHTTSLDVDPLFDFGGGVEKPYLENIVANGLEYLKPGKVVLYNSTGFDLAGKVMEIVSGKSAFRLMHENFFEPLGLNDPTITFLSGGMTCSVEDMARVAQVVCNRGSYGQTEFFSAESFEKFRPHPYKESFPYLENSSWNYGMGIGSENFAHPSAGKNGIPADATVLSKNTIGHGGDGHATLLVDLDNELVIVQNHFDYDKNYMKNLTSFLLAISESLAD